MSAWRKVRELRGVNAMMRVVLKRLGILSLLVAVAACGQSGHTSKIEKLPDGKVVERIYSNYGGFINREMSEWRARVRKHGIRHYIIDGSCYSFCTFVALYAPESCYTKNVRFFLHPASMYGMYENGATQAWTKAAVALWPKGLRDWWANNRPGISGVFMDYDDLYALIPERACKGTLAEGHGRERIAMSDY